MTRIAFRKLLPLLLLPLAAWSCAGSGSLKPAAGEVAVMGTVRYVDLEGGFHVIQGDDGVTYDPLNLDPAFQVPGRRVQAVGVIRRDLAAIHQVGPILQIRKIQALPDGPAGDRPAGGY